MKRVKVYNISEHVECVVGDVVEIMNCRDSARVYSDGELISPSLMVAPIQRSVHFLGHLMGLRVHACVDETGGVEYIAMWPQLYDLLRVPFKAEIASAREEAKLHRDSSKAWESLARAQLDSADEFRGLSLWGRLKCAWRGDLPMK